jgi:tetratricopeptide (TPR) repeat protein
MKSISSFALAAALVFGGGSIVATAPAAAQQGQPQREFKFSKEERAALAPVQTAVDAKNWAAAAAALPAAQSAARGADARYVLARFQFAIGRETNNIPLQSQGLDGIIASGVVTGADLAQLVEAQAALATQAGNHAKAEAAYARLVELNPNNPQALVNLAKIKNDQKKPGEAVQLLDRAIAARLAAGQKPDESWYKYALKLAFDGKMAAQSSKLARDLVVAYPTKENWRDALLIYRDLNTLDKGTQLDLLRLGRATKSLAGERDWYELAYMLHTTGFPAEAKAVLEEGGAMKMVDLNKPAFRELLRLATARFAGDRASLPGEETKALAAATGATALTIGDAYFGYADYAKAATLYRAALTKGSVDANVVNTRLGMALALAGNRAEAETAFKAVTGPRAELASFWLTWLAQRA